MTSKSKEYGLLAVCLACAPFAKYVSLRTSIRGLVPSVVVPDKTEGVLATSVTAVDSFESILPFTIFVLR